MTMSEAVTVEASAPLRAPRKSKLRPYVILAIVVALGVGAYFAFTWWTRGKESTDDAQVDADVVPVSARVAGVLLHVRVVDNQAVKKGELLAEIDPAELSAKVKQTEAELAAARAQSAAAEAQVAIVVASSKGGLSAARAQLSGSATSVAGADAQIASAKASVARAEAEAARADNDLARAEALIKDQAIPQAQVDTARSNAAAARAAVAQARARSCRWRTTCVRRRRRA